jgi:Flp pilus assembly protein TadG
MKSNKLQNAKKTERGQSLTELAVSFTLLMMLLGIAVDGGRLFFSYIAVREAAEEGALHGALYPSDSDGISERVRTSSSNPVDLTDTSLVSVADTLIGSACAGNSIRVTVTYTFNLTMPFVGAILGSQQFPLAAESTATVLRPGC